MAFCSLEPELVSLKETFLLPGPPTNQNAQLIHSSNLLIYPLTFPPTSWPIHWPDNPLTHPPTWKLSQFPTTHHLTYRSIHRPTQQFTCLPTNTTTDQLPTQRCNNSLTKRLTDSPTDWRLINPTTSQTSHHPSDSLSHLATQSLGTDTPIHQPTDLQSDSPIQLLVYLPSDKSQTNHLTESLTNPTTYQLNHWLKWLKHLSVSYPTICQPTHSPADSLTTLREDRPTHEHINPPTNTLGGKTHTIYHTNLAIQPVTQDSVTRQPNYWR